MAILSLSLWESWWCQGGEWVAWVLERMEQGLCPCQSLSLSLRGSWPEKPWPPSGGLGYANQFKNRTQNGFHSLQLPREKKKKDFFSFLLAPGRNGLFCTRSKYTKHSFLVKSATGGKKSNIAGAQRICCACEIILLTISLWLASCLWLRIKIVILECTAGSNLWPLSLLS